MNYDKNTNCKTKLDVPPVLSDREKALLAGKSALVLGLGGLGGYLCEFLCRLGIGHLTVTDGDVFEVSNLDRQLNASENTLGNSKARETARRILSIRPDCRITAVEEYFAAENAKKLMRGQDIVLDGLDSPSARLLAADTASALGIPFIHGAIDGWNLQAASVLPGNQLLHLLYPAEKPGRIPGQTLSFVPAVCAGIQVSEAAKLLCGQKAALENRLFLMDLSTLETQTIDFP